ncbi:LytTR family DNA-binding domain-containing protein [Muricauda oceani]|uniref:Response regulator transcription factor n=1 Tax=Flagellimonas oceani TaxID=2698672 RepID=A0A6G7J0H5_9FLAO|nr:LytTR family DNA-binding domain-containing protein [Allomuricauda oceani]MBW8243636.1 LytTR family DNA-binding domain-containing protein [Allomuricauda oceani]QII43997.1 response regulator transcription factor [Allomuricauda oceani]
MKKSIDVLILEDEKLNSDRVERLLSEIRKDVKVVGVLPSIKKSVEWFAINKDPDLVLMDVKLADGSSFDIFDQVDIGSPVVFTTAYDEYAIKAFKYKSVDYLLKPVDKEELASALLKFDSMSQKSHLGKPVIEELIAQVRPKKYRNRFLIPHRDTYKKVDVADIAFIHSFESTSYIYLFSGEKMSVPQTLESLEQELNPDIFFRVNRQYIVHMDSIESVQDHFNGKLKLIIGNNKEGGIMISRTKAPLFKAWLEY